MVAQGLLDFQYEGDSSSHGLTSLAGLAVFFDLIKAIGLGAAIRRHVRAAGGQGWLDIQMVLAVIFLNLAGGDCVDDIERLEGDSGFSAILRAIERNLFSRAERRSLTIACSMAAETPSSRIAPEWKAFKNITHAEFTSHLFQSRSQPWEGTSVRRMKHTEANEPRPCKSCCR